MSAWFEGASRRAGRPASREGAGVDRRPHRQTASRLRGSALDLRPGQPGIRGAPPGGRGGPQAHLRPASERLEAGRPPPPAASDLGALAARWARLAWLALLTRAERSVAVAASSELTSLCLLQPFRGNVQSSQTSSGDSLGCQTQQEGREAFVLQVLGRRPHCARATPNPPSLPPACAPGSTLITAQGLWQVQASLAGLASPPRNPGAHRSLQQPLARCACRRQRRISAARLLGVAPPPRAAAAIPTVPATHALPQAPPKR